MKLPPKRKRLSTAAVLEWCDRLHRPDLRARIEEFPPEQDFTWDGTSGFPDRLGKWDFDLASFEHDIGYWCGLPTDEQARWVEDCRFAINLVTKCGVSPGFAETMFIAVRRGGVPNSKFPWRYGYGRK